MMSRVALSWFCIIALAACTKKQSGASTAATPPPLAEVPPVAPAPQVATPDLARGEYVATLGGCVVCHTPLEGGEPDLDRLLAGGLEVKTAGGTWRTPNITPDRETGIGAWTDEQLTTAIRQGIRNDGVKLLAVMPSSYFHRMTDDDARDLVAFLRAQRPVVNRVALSDRLAEGPVELAGAVDADRSDPKAQGEYLANLMHCGACHTPQEGPYTGMAGAGGMAFQLPDGTALRSANITSDQRAGIGRWSEAQVVAAVRTMRKADGSRIKGPMTMYRDAWSKLTDDDAHALAVYIKSIPAVRNEVPPRPPAVTKAP